MCVHGVTAGIHAAGYEHDVADLQRADGRFVERWRQPNFTARTRESLLIDHRDQRIGRIAIEPLFDRSITGVEAYAQAAERPAVVRDRNKKAGWQSVEHADLAADQTDVAAKPHRADAKRVDRAHDGRLEFGETGVGIHIV